MKDYPYKATFDKEYSNKTGILIPTVPEIIKTEKDIRSWIDAFDSFKKAINKFFEIKNTGEREFQQLIVRDNNSTDSEYFITDIEFQEENTGPRPDMLAFRWLESSQENTCNLRPVIIEIKKEDKALSGDSGIFAHLQGFHKIITNETSRDILLRTMKIQLQQMLELDLINPNSKFLQCKNLEIILDDTPEILLSLPAIRRAEKF